MKYDPQLIEKKWQRFWAENKSFKAYEDRKRPKYYVLDMFPYPSGAGLHVGHTVGYTATDVIARYKLAKGFSVLHPMGWDSFGLQAEQYAIRTGTHPRTTTAKNISNFKSQLQAIGYAYDWDREIRTSDPKYYKWTQWIFTKLYEKGLAYQAEMLVNWCPNLRTVLANEEVEGGLSKEGGHPVERRLLKQWVLKITEYADRLLEDLEELDWSDGLKRLQKNWIGKSEGAEIDFHIEGFDEKIRVFTTCPHTIFGVTYMVLSPEHPLVNRIATRNKEVEHYQKLTAEKSDIERSELSKEKSGVFTGGYAYNPVTEERIPIWIADYVLMGYGTGAIMAVPAHDERDYEFAEKFELPIRPVLDERNILMNSTSSTLQLDGESIEVAIEKSIEWLESKGFGKKSVNYKLRDWLFSRQRYWGEPFPILKLADGRAKVLALDELPVELPEVSDFKPSASGESPLAKVTEWVEVDEGIRRETDTMPQWAGSCWYYLRFCDPENSSKAWDEKKESYWMPVDMYVGGAEHAVLHLLYARFWHKVLYDLGLVSTSEPFQKLVNQGLVISRAYQKEGGLYVEPSEVVQKEGKYFHWETGEELRSQIEKMSKSKLNGVSPDEVIEEFGADAMRLYAMFMGPIEKEKIWNTDGVSGCRRFLNRFFEVATSEKVSSESDEEGMRLAHRLVHGVTEDLERLLFNTAISKMMEYVNAMMKLSSYPKAGIKMAVQVLAPFAPHLAEELWQHLGEQGCIAFAPWPESDPRYLVEEQVTYVVQVNGKVRASLDLAKEEDQATVEQLAKNEPSVAKYLEKGETLKVIFVPGKLLNFVVR